MAASEEKPKRRPGRPPKSPEKGHRRNYAFRMSDQTRDRVIAAANSSGRSMSEEMELRIEKSFDQEDYIDSTFRRMLGGPFSQKMVLGISNLLNMIEIREKKSILADVSTAMLAFVAMHELVDKMFANPEIPENIQSLMRKDIEKLVDHSEGIMASSDMIHVLRNMAAADMFARIARGEDLNFESYEDLRLALDAQITGKPQN